MLAPDSWAGMRMTRDRWAAPAWAEMGTSLVDEALQYFPPHVLELHELLLAGAVTAHSRNLR